MRLNEDYFPLQSPLIGKDMEAHYEEERRLAYVALSRARKGLFLSYLEEEGRRPLVPSRFLTEFSDRLTTRKRVDTVPTVPSQNRTSQKRKISAPSSRKRPK